MPFLEQFLLLSPGPGPRKTEGGGEVDPLSPDFSGFIFKIQANMNPAHRDRLAFLRICSGVFERGMSVTLARTGKPVKLAQSTQLMGNGRENVDRAYAGDIIGIYDTGLFQIGDTLCAGKEPFRFEPLPTFPPELFAQVRPQDTMKTKQFQKGVAQLAQEGAIQVYHDEYRQTVIGAVGQLQFEVFSYRLENEYNAPLRLESLPFSVARWLKDPDVEKIRPTLESRVKLVYDRFERPLLLFANPFALTYYRERHEGVELLEATEI